MGNVISEENIKHSFFILGHENGITGTETIALPANETEQQRVMI